MKRIFILFFLMTSLISCGGSDENLEISTSVIEFNGEWAINSQIVKEIPFTVYHESDVKAYVTSPQINENKIIVATGSREQKSTNFVAIAYLGNIEAGEQHFPVEIQLRDSSNKIVASKELDVIVRLKDSLSLHIDQNNSTVYANYNEVDPFSFVNMYVMTSSLNYTVVESSGLLSLSKNSGRGTQSIIGTYKPVNNEAGLHKTKITVSSTEQNISKYIEFNIDIDRPRWSFERPGFIFNQLADSSYLSSTMQILHTSNMPDNTFSASTNVSWLQVQMIGNQLAARVNSQGLVDGTYSADITVKSAGIAEQPEQKLAVTFYVNKSVSKDDSFVFLRENPNNYMLKKFGIYLVEIVSNRMNFINIFTGKIENTLVLPPADYLFTPFLPIASKDGRFVQVFKKDWDRNQHIIIGHDFYNGEQVSLSTISGWNGVGQYNKIDLLDFFDKDLRLGRGTSHYNKTSAVNFDLNFSHIISIDVNKVFVMKTTYPTNDLASNDFNIFEVSVLKNGSIVNYKKVLSSGVIKGVLQTPELDNGMIGFYNDYDKVISFYKFDSQGYFVKHEIKDFDYRYDHVCSIDDSTLYRINVDENDSNKLMISKIDLAGNVLASRAKVLDAPDYLQGCTTFEVGQKLILNFAKSIQIEASL